MRAGTLNCRITVQQLGGGVDALGQPLQSWTDVATLWANVRHSSGVESIKADAVTTVVRASIRIRHRIDITAGMRVVAGVYTYNIVTVLPDIGGKEYTDLVCEVMQ